MSLIPQTPRFVYKSCDYFPSATIFCYFSSPRVADVFFATGSKEVGKERGKRGGGELVEAAGRTTVEIAVNDKLETDLTAPLNNCFWYLRAFT